jgi:hypothetical protein
MAGLQVTLVWVADSLIHGPVRGDQWRLGHPALITFARRTRSFEVADEGQNRTELGMVLTREPRLRGHRCPRAETWTAVHGRAVRFRSIQPYPVLISSKKARGCCGRGCGSEFMKSCARCDGWLRTVVTLANTVASPAMSSMATKSHRAFLAAVQVLSVVRVPRILLALTWSFGATLKPAGVKRCTALQGH